MTGPLPALIFDYDGVLADTEPLHWRSWAKLLLSYGIGLTWEEYRASGRGIDDVQFCESIQKKWPHLDANELLERNVERKQSVCELSLAMLPVPQEIVALLTSLRTYRMGLVTSSERSNVAPVLQACNILDKFEALVFGEEVATRKPSPEPYLLIKQKLAIKTGIAFEDSTPGAESASTAGLQVVRVESPHHLAQILASPLFPKTGK